jgi:hypothetical protein
MIFYSIVHLTIVLMIFQILVVDLFVTSIMCLLPHTAWFVIVIIGELMELLLVRITKENGTPLESFLSIIFDQAFADDKRVLVLHT